jgi:hypothetical protein
MKSKLFICLCVLLSTVCSPVRGGEGPYFVSYSQQMEEPGNLEVENSNLLGKPSSGNRFLGSAFELEYGLLGWWTTEVYLDGQVTFSDSTVFTGYRWENRFRVAKREHWINPVLYFEFEDINGADKTLLEVVGHDRESDLVEPNGSARYEKKREMEGKLLLGSNWRGWKFSENIIIEKNLAHAPWEFGYALGTYRPLALEASPDRCNVCLENFSVGAEMYGGLGDTESLGLHDTSHYVAPVMAWTLANGTKFKISPSFGVTQTSAPFLLRLGISYEISQLGRRLRRP